MLDGFELARKDQKIHLFCSRFFQSVLGKRTERQTDHWVIKSRTCDTEGKARNWERKKVRDRENDRDSQKETKGVGNIRQKEVRDRENDRDSQKETEGVGNMRQKA